MDVLISALLQTAAAQEEASFAEFEKIAMHEAWPKTHWGNLVFGFIGGDAQKGHCELDPKILRDYEKVKTEILTKVGVSQAARLQCALQPNSDAGFKVAELLKEQVERCSAAEKLVRGVQHQPITDWTARDSGKTVPGVMGAMFNDYETVHKNDGTVHKKAESEGGVSLVDCVNSVQGGTNLCPVAKSCEGGEPLMKTDETVHTVQIGLKKSGEQKMLNAGLGENVLKHTLPELGPSAMNCPVNFEHVQSDNVFVEKLMLCSDVKRTAATSDRTKENLCELAIEGKKMTVLLDPRCVISLVKSSRRKPDPAIVSMQAGIWGYKTVNVCISTPYGTIGHKVAIEPSLEYDVVLGTDFQFFQQLWEDCQVTRAGTPDRPTTLDLHHTLEESYSAEAEDGECQQLLDVGQIGVCQTAGGAEDQTVSQVQEDPVTQVTSLTLTETESSVKPETDQVQEHGFHPPAEDESKVGLELRGHLEEVTGKEATEMSVDNAEVLKRVHVELGAVLTVTDRVLSEGDVMSGPEMDRDQEGRTTGPDVVADPGALDLSAGQQRDSVEVKEKSASEQRDSPERLSRNYPEAQVAKTLEKGETTPKGGEESERVGLKEETGQAQVTVRGQENVTRSSSESKETAVSKRSRKKRAGLGKKREQIQNLEETLQMVSAKLSQKEEVVHHLTEEKEKTLADLNKEQEATLQLQKDMERHKSEFAALQDELSRSQGLMTSKERELEILAKQISFKDEEVNVLCGAYLALQSDHKARLVAMEELEKEKVVMAHKVQSLEAQNETHIKSRAASLDALGTQLSEQEAQLKVYEQKVSKMAQLNKDNEQMREQLLSLEDTVKNLTELLESEKKNSSKLKSEQQKCLKLEGDMKVLKESRDQVIAELANERLKVSQMEIEAKATAVRVKEEKLLVRQKLLETGMLSLKKAEYEQWTQETVESEDHEKKPYERSSEADTEVKPYGKSSEAAEILTLHGENSEAEKFSEVEVKPEITAEAASKVSDTSEGAGEKLAKGAKSFQSKNEPVKVGVPKERANKKAESLKRGHCDRRLGRGGNPERHWIRKHWKKVRRSRIWRRVRLKEKRDRCIKGKPPEIVEDDLEDLQMGDTGSVGHQQSSCNGHTSDRRRQWPRASALSAPSVQSTAQTKMKNLVLERCDMNGAFYKEFVKGDQKSCARWLMKVRMKEGCTIEVVQIKSTDEGSQVPQNLLDVVVQGKGKAVGLCLLNTSAPSRWSEQRGGDMWQCGKERVYFPCYLCRMLHLWPD
ncbi:uncharacterized protein LOC130368398 [Hyla sarda]|uniref:uncharacterized protein LOC130368398 n=1 Tax=Hyla sarda TaxID=327740 RepID=UPI0024C28B39|nr:uncharacterized protein LOC130368398 [Hyla sarda]